MNTLADISFSPLNKLEEPCESWWIDWYPLGHAKPESVLYKPRDTPVAWDVLTQGTNDIDSLALSSKNCLVSKVLEQDPKQPAVVPCIAQDLEQEIAELEQQALSSGSLDSDFGVFDDDLAYDGATSSVTSGMDQKHSSHLQGWQQLTRKHSMPSLTVEVQPRCNADDLLDSTRGSSHASGRPGDITPSSEDDACTHISGSFSSPKSIATHFTSTATFLPQPVPIASSPSDMYRTINLARKPARQSDRFKPSIPSCTHAPAPPVLPRPPGAASTLPASSTSPHSSLEAVSETGSDVSSKPVQDAPPAPAQQQQLKRSSAQLASPVSKVARLERPRREGAGTHSHGAASSNADAAAAGALGGLCSVSRGTAGWRNGKKGAEGRALAMKGKPKVGKAGAGSPRGKKRGTGKCAPPAPGVHACSQCGAQSTPVWRAGPYGPKTLCNACGVRYMKIAKRK